MDYPQAIVSLVVFGICILLGLPVWWNTTKVYRANLPDQRIISAQSTQIKLRTNIEIVLNKTDIDLLESIKSSLSNNRRISFGLYLFEFDFKFTGIHIDGRNPESYCSNINIISDRNGSLSYKFLLIQDMAVTDFSYYCNEVLSTVIITNKLDGTVTNQIMLLMKTYLNLEELSSNHRSVETVDNAKHRPSLNMPPAVAYSIVLTLAVANPTDFMPSWNIQDAIDHYLSPFLSKLNFLGKIKISSQVVYFVNFKEKPLQDGERYYYTEEKLPFLMNEVQPRLMTYTSTDATLHFIVYIPPAIHTPLYIKNEKMSENSSFTNSFHSARWGGLHFFNPDTTNVKEFAVPIDTLMKNVIFQIGHLFGLSHLKSVNMFPRNKITYISAWSQTSLMITKTYEYLNKSLSTLISLYKLLGEIENIVISEEIKYLIESSLDSYEKSIRYLEYGFIDEAVRDAKSSYAFSEKAFYDASLLALLYFPDDQKYAIYVPLFVPIAFPIVGSVYRAILWLRKKEQSI